MTKQTIELPIEHVDGAGAIKAGFRQEWMGGSGGGVQP